MFLNKYVKKWSMKKDSKKESKNVTQAGRFAAEAGVSGGGGGFASHLCKYLASPGIQHAMLPLMRCGGSQSPAASSGRGD